MKKLATFLLLALTLNLVGCGAPWWVKGNDGKLHSWTNTAKDFVDELNGVGILGQWKLAKARTHQYGFVILESVNPNPCAGLVNDCVPGEPTYIAVDIRGFKLGMNIFDFSPSLATGIHIPGLFFPLAKNGDDYDYSSGGVQMHFSEDVEGGKDLEGVGALMERESVSSLSEKLVANYGLSNERAEKVARLTSSYAKLATKRSLTDSEMNSYTQELLGMNYNEAQRAVEGTMQGDSNAYNRMIERAASKNGLSPEQVQSVMGDLLLK